METQTLLNFTCSQMLDILKANCNARLLWRAQRKLEAYRGRAVLRAAKKALDQAAVEVVGTGAWKLCTMIVFCWCRSRLQSRESTSSEISGRSHEHSNWWTRSLVISPARLRISSGLRPHFANKIVTMDPCDIAWRDFISPWTRFAFSVALHNHALWTSCVEPPSDSSSRLPPPFGRS